MIEIEKVVEFVYGMFLKDKIEHGYRDPFCDSFKSCLGERYKDHWYPENPERGNGYRCIRINHKLDPILVRAAQRCGLEIGILKHALPAELTLWVDPGCVSFRIGETGSISEVEDTSKSRQPKSASVPIPNAKGMSPDVDEGYSSALSVSPSPPPHQISNPNVFKRMSSCKELFQRSSFNMRERCPVGLSTYVAS